MSSPTKRALAASFKKLLGCHPLNKITVKDIVEDAQVNRQTFYYHFHDVYDLIQWILEEESQAALGLEDRLDDWKNHIRDVLEAMRQEKSLVLNIVHSLNREHLEQYLCSVIDTFIYDSLEKNCEGLVVSDDDIRFIADFFKYAFVGILMDWILKGMKEEPKVLSERLILMLDGEPRRSLVKFTA